MDTLIDGLFFTYPSWSTFVVRVTLGVIFFAHGAQKVLGWFGGNGLAATTKYFVSTGIPLPVAYLVSFFEFLGGIGLVLGLLTRPAALAVIVVMVGAIAKVHWQHGFFLNWSLTPGKGHGYEANLAFIAMALACLIAGGGALSADRLLLGPVTP
ncbi:MAG TPA: DoxX family protein [Vicinamibacteria bacterium]|nr:DoxX family protein [Vicinamibacteria bacterium]